MEREQYKAEQLWLNSYFDYIGILDLNLSVEIEMRNSGVSLPEILDVLKTGAVTWADRGHDGCSFKISGRNCDDEDIEILGIFCSEIEMVSIVSIRKSR